MPVIFPLSIAFLAGLSMLLWFSVGLPWLLGSTLRITEFCQSLFVRCVEYYDFLKILLPWAGAALLASGLIYGVIRGIIRIIRAERTVKGLPVIYKGRVALIRDANARAAFTHGFLRPRVYISTGLLRWLERDELKAVFLHELHHMRRFDPLRFFLFSLIKDIFFYIPAAGELIGEIRARREHEADDASTSSGGHLSLAGAILKVASYHSISAIPASITGGPGNSALVRVRRLVEGEKARFRPPSFKAVSLSVVVASLLGLSLAMPLQASPVSNECSTKHCALHMNRLGADCKTHCDTQARKGHVHMHR